MFCFFLIPAIKHKQKGSWTNKTQLPCLLQSNVRWFEKACFAHFERDHLLICNESLLWMGLLSTWEARG